MLKSESFSFILPRRSLERVFGMRSETSGTLERSSHTFPAEAVLIADEAQDAVVSSFRITR